MKKWWVITGILVLLLAISWGVSLSSSSEVRDLEVELSDVRERLSDFSVDLVVAKQDLSHAEAELEAKVAELESARSELESMGAVLVREINFGNGLRVFDIEKGYYEVRGKVQNVSTEPMDKVVVVVAFYNANGKLDEDWGSVDTARVYDLFPQETTEWEVHFGNWTDQDIGLFAVYAIGNRED